MAQIRSQLMKLSDENKPKHNGVVLIVMMTQASMLNAALCDAQLTALVALSGEQALTIARRIRPDLILMDAMMPGMDGLKPAKKLKPIHDSSYSGGIYDGSKCQ